MADLNDFIYTDGVHDVLAAYVNRLLAATLRSEYKNIETLSADRELTDADTPIQRLDCNGADRVVTMPVADAVNNHPFWILNASDGGETLTVKSNSGTLVYAVLNNGNAVYLLPNGAGGYSPVGLSNNGWLPASGTWSYSSADSPIFVANVPDADATEINVGDRIMLTQTTVKYFIVHAKGSPSGGFTPITIYGGTDYSLANAAITAPHWSHVNSPLGFPMNEDKWSEIVESTITFTKTSPTATSWYNAMDSGNLPSINIPIGKWKGYYQLFMYATSTASQAAINIFSTLSSANNSESDSKTTCIAGVGGANGTLVVNASVSKVIEYNVSSKQIRYLNIKTNLNAANINVAGVSVPIQIKLVSAYL